MITICLFNPNTRAHHLYLRSIRLAYLPRMFIATQHANAKTLTSSLHQPPPLSRPWLGNCEPEPRYAASAGGSARSHVTSSTRVGC